MKARPGVALAAGFSMSLLPRLVEACPMCSSQQPGGVARIIALGVMLLLPFSIAFLVFKVLRRASAPESGDALDAAVTRGGVDPGVRLPEQGL